MMKTAGIHHITAIVGNVQQTVDFYAHFLGLRLVKQTVNFDDPTTYHLYFGDTEGSPGTIMTFFPWDEGKKGAIGGGQVGLTVFAVPTGALDFWEERCIANEVPYTKAPHLGEVYLIFKDEHGLQLAIVEQNFNRLRGWTTNEISNEVAIQGFAGAMLYSAEPYATIRVIEKILGFQKVKEDKTYVRFQSDSSVGQTIDISKQALKKGEMGIGTIHHIAFRAKDDTEQRLWQQYVTSQGYHVTAIHDRQYFKAIYFREQGGVLFEIATDPPGFTVDESLADLGEVLQLPKQYEANRRQITNILPAFTI